MLALLEITSEAPSDDLFIAPWIPLLVALVVAAGSLGAAWWNTRGESAALRQLKAMNEAIEGIPANRKVANDLSAARDRLAGRIAESDIRRSTFWRRFGIPSLAALTGLALTAFGVWGSLQMQPSAEAVATAQVTALVSVATAAVIVVVSVVSNAIAQSRRRAAAQDQNDQSVG